MIRTNLSTRPFYNERVIGFALILLAMIVVAASIFNATRIVQLSRSDTRLLSDASRDEARAADLRATATRLRAGVDLHQIDLISADARRANNLIDRRTFSWTELFNIFESTLPDEVRITSVKPNIDSKSGTTIVAITVVARTIDDVNQFVENLEKTGAFGGDLFSRQDRFNDQGLLEATLEPTYLPLAGTGTATGTGKGRQ
jgi:Tfp pilus assembly protein PilN